MTTLFEYEDVAPPTLKETPRKEIPVPNPRMHGMAGIVGLLTRDDSLAYVSRRTKEEHRFRKYDGYAVSDQILAFLSERDVATVLIAEMDTGAVFEYDMVSFTESGIRTDEEDGDPQTCVPVSMARREWPRHAALVY